MTRYWTPNTMSLGDAIIQIEKMISDKKGELWSLEMALEIMKEEQRRPTLSASVRVEEGK